MNRRDLIKAFSAGAVSVTASPLLDGCVGLETLKVPDANDSVRMARLMRVVVARGRD